MDIQTGFVCLLKLLVAILVMCMVRCEDEGEEGEKEQCLGIRHVCTTLMQYPDGYVANEGPYCKCSMGDCGSAWSEDERGLTWKHYERGHWKVQYRFCTPVGGDSLPVCEFGERAAVIKTDVAKWKPYLEENRCRCRDGMHHMTGWMKDGLVWKYFYDCDKKECEAGDDVVCARIIVDTNRKSDIVKEVIFRCTCPHGSLCPAKVKDESAVEGREVIVKCEPIEQLKNDKNKKSSKNKV